MLRLSEQIHLPHLKPCGYHCPLPPHEWKSSLCPTAGDYKETNMLMPFRLTYWATCLCFSMHTSWWPDGMWFRATDFRCLVCACLKLICLFCALVERNRHVQLVIQLHILDSYPTQGWFACLLPFTEDSAWSVNFWTFRGIMFNEINSCLGAYLWAIW